jgi:hypothetical protein
MLLKPLNEFGSEDPKELRGFLFKYIPWKVITC